MHLCIGDAEQSLGMKTQVRICWREFLHFKFNNNNTKFRSHLTQNGIVYDSFSDLTSHTLPFTLLLSHSGFILPNMSPSVGFGGCGLCGKDQEERTAPGVVGSETGTKSSSSQLTPMELEVVIPFMNSLRSQDNFNAESDHCESPHSGSPEYNKDSFCGDCVFLFKEMKRVKALLGLLNSQLDKLVVKLKAKYENRTVVWVKVETDDEDFNNNE